MQKIDAFKEHTLALQRHMDNTSNYLQKEVDTVDVKIDEAKAMLFKELNLNLYNETNCGDSMTITENR